MDNRKNDQGHYKKEFINEVLEYRENHSSSETAQKFSIGERQIRKWRSKFIFEEQAQPFVPHNHSLKGVSTLVRARPDGTHEETLRWIKTNATAEQQKQALDKIAENLCKRIKPYKPRKRKVKHLNSDLMHLYTLSDFHLGMFSHKEESGDDWSTDKAIEYMRAWSEMSVNNAPNAHTGVFLQLGDFFHQDGIKPVTNQSGHALDSDSRFWKAVDVGVDALRYHIDLMLEKHEHVHVIMCDGNHDQASAIWLRKMFDVAYGDDPRVTIDRNETVYYAYQWGDTAIFAHHGDKKRAKQVGDVFVAMHAKMFGDTKWRYGHVGHLHHRAAFENGTMQVRVHPNLPARDAYASRGGWLSQRGAVNCTYSKVYGFVGETTTTPLMIKDYLQGKL